MSGRTSLRDQIAAKRAEATRGGPASPAPTIGSRREPTTFSNRPQQDGDGLVEEVTVSSQIQKAVKSGKLDFGSLRFEHLPHTVYTQLLGIPSSDLSHPPSSQPDKPHHSETEVPLTPGRSSFPQPSEGQTRESIFGTNISNNNAQQARDDIWVEPEELISFKAIDCGLLRLEKEFGAFGGLKVVNLRGNGLSSLPDAFADLLRLTALDLSHNALTSIPPATVLLPALLQLDISHNGLTSVDLSSPIQPSDDGLSYGAGFLTTSFSRLSTKPKRIWPSLSTLNLGFNRISSAEIDFKPASIWESITSVNLESNALSGILDVEKVGLGMEDAPGLVNLNLSGNPGLHGSTRGLAPKAVVDETGNSSQNGSTTGNSVSESKTSASTPAATKPPLAEGTEARPSPNLTIVYRTCPAATFDSEPLPLEFDLYLPPTPGNHPLLIWWHGGGLLQGNKENLPPHFRRLPKHSFDGTNIAVLSPNYRLAPQAPILDILSDSTALLTYVREKLNDRLKKEGDGKHSIDVNRICVSGGSAGGYLALLAGLPVAGSDEEVGGYRGEKGIKCIAPFYPITDLTDKFWATETNPVPWSKTSVPHAAAKPHIDKKAAPIATAVSGGPRSILYSYMLQHGLFPGLLFQNQKSVGNSLDAFRPTPETLSIPQRVDTLKGGPIPPIYFIYGTDDNKVNPFERTLESLKKCNGAGESLVIEERIGEDHGFDEDEREECLAFRQWLGKTLV